MRPGRVLVVALASVLLVAPALPRDETVPFAGLIARGQAALHAKEHAAAQALLARAVALRPADAGAHYLLARAYGEDQKYQPAATHLRRVLELSPGHAPALIDLAAIESNSGRFKEAESRYQEAIRSGGGARAERGLASLMARQGRAEEAIRLLRALVAADAADLESRYQLGLALMHQADCAGAIPELSAVAERDPSHPGALFNLGNCLNRTGRLEEGARALERFRALSAEKEQRVDRERRAYFLLLDADGKLDRADFTGALGAIDRALELHPASARAHAMRGQCLDAMDDAPRALDAFLKAAGLDPADPIVLVEAGRLLGKLGRFEEAVGFLKKAAAADPLMPEPHLFLAAAYHQLGRGAEAAASQATYRRLAGAARRPD